MRCLFLLSIIILFTGCGLSETSEDHLLRARQFIQNDKQQEALIELKNALSKDPENAEARWLLGSIYLEKEEMSNAEKELMRAKELNWNKDDVLPLLAKTWLALGKYDQVLELSSESLSPEADIQLLSSQALARLAKNEVVEGLKLVGQALDIDPTNSYVRLVDARFSMFQGDFDRSLKILNGITEEIPENAEAWRLKGDIYTYQKRLSNARSAYDKSISLDSNAYLDRLKRGLINLQSGEIEAAEVDALELLKVAPTSPPGNLLQGLLYFRTKKYEEAVSSLSIAEGQATKFPLLLYYLSSAHLMEGNLDQAGKFASRFVVLVPENPDGRKLLAAIRLQQGDTAEVRELLDPVLVDAPNDPDALNIMASALIKEGGIDEGLNLLERVAAIQPDSTVAKLRLGTGLMLSGKAGEAGEQFETVLELDPKAQQADILLIMNLLQQKEYDKAIEAARKYQLRNLTSANGYNLLGRVYLASGKRDEAVASFNKAMEVEPDNPSALFSLASLALIENDTAKARQYYEAVLKSHPDDLTALVYLAGLEERQKNDQAMIKWLELAIEKHPEALKPKVMLARHYLGSGNAGKVIPLMSSVSDLQRNTRPVLELTALAQMSNDVQSDATPTLEQLIELSPGNPTYHYLLALATGKAGNSERSHQELLKTIQLESKYVPALIALAKLENEAGRYDEFLKYLKELKALAPKNVEVLRLQAIEAMNKQEFGRAIEFSKAAFSKAPTTQGLLELTAYQKMSGNSDESKLMLADWLEKNPRDTKVRLAFASALDEEGDPDDARQQYASVLKLEPDNIAALNNLAWLLRKTRPHDALGYINHAFELAPDKAEVLDTLAVIEHLNGQNEKAYRSISKALEKEGGNLTMTYHMAMIVAALGNTKDAISILEKLVVSKPAFPEQDEALQLLESLTRQISQKKQASGG